MPPKKNANAPKKAAAPKMKAKASKAKASKRNAPERAGVQKLRTLAGVDAGGKAPKRAASDAAAAKKARALLEEEFERVLSMKEKMRAEASIGGQEKGREAQRQDEKIRGMIASLEGMNRFALKMGLIAPAESRELYAGAMKRGLHEGTR